MSKMNSHINECVLISKQENRYKTREHIRATQQVTTKSEFDERWDKNTGIKKETTKRILLPRSTT